MPANIEIKATIKSAHHLSNIISKLIKRGCKEVEIAQHDTFFHSASGRLKFRLLKSESQLVYYERSDKTGPKHSDYTIVRFTDTEQINGMKKILTSTCGVKGVVEKVRKLYLLDQTRIHIDEVRGLNGTYIEFEVILKENQSSEEGIKIANDLMSDLNISEEDLIEGSYLDLLIKKKMDT